MKCEIEMKPLIKQMTCTVRGAKKAAWRVRLSTPVFWLAGRIAGFGNVTVEIE